MKILIIPGNNLTAKSYPFWKEFKELIKEHEVKELTGILTESEIITLINWCDIWISIDSFLPHLVECYNLKSGIVIWGKSDPEIFGYPTNINLLKDKKYLRKNQFDTWFNETIDSNVFVSPNDLLLSLKCDTI